MDIRPFRADDAEQVRALTVRLTEGVAPWRDSALVRAAVDGWVSGTLAAAGRPGSAVLVAVDGEQVVGFVSVASKTHWSGETDGYVGELAVAKDAERRGVGRALLATAEQWARDAGYGRLQLETGAFNAPALAFYAANGYESEDVRLSKNLHQD